VYDVIANVLTYSFHHELDREFFGRMREQFPPIEHEVSNTQRREDFVAEEMFANVLFGKKMKTQFELRTTYVTSNTVFIATIINNHLTGHSYFMKFGSVRSLSEPTLDGPITLLITR